MFSRALYAVAGSMRPVKGYSGSRSILRSASSAPLERSLKLDGNNLSLQDIENVSRGLVPAINLCPEAVKRMVRSRSVVNAACEAGNIVYGITTGFGRLSEVAIAPARVEELQLNLIRSHACGVGVPLSREQTRAIMLLRANVLAKGFSGIRPLVVDLLVQMLNKNVHPVIPSQGSVGASGDLAPLSHIALVLIGEGEAEVDGKVMPGGDALKLAGLQPVRLQAKEGLALNNGTQAMTGIGALTVLAAERAVETAEVAGAMSLEGLRGTPDAFHEAIHRVRPHAGQRVSAERLRHLLRSSEIRDSHLHNDPRVQDAYSLRCMPQIHGAARSALTYVTTVLETESNSATDNPLIFPGEGPDGKDLVLSGGNFHGQPIAQVLDLLAIALADLASVSERRIERLVNPDLSGDLPPFLTTDAGVRSGFMIAQITAAALVSESRVLAHPSSVDSIPTGAGKEDHVSMGMMSARKAVQVLQNTERVLAIELLCAAQALEHRKPLRPGVGAEVAYNRLREVVAPLNEDRNLSIDIEAAAKLVAAGKFADIWKL
jgi:histidine ammonia-lyase